MQRTLLAVVAAPLVLYAAAFGTARLGLSYGPPHRVRPPAAVLEPALRAELGAAREDPLDFALETTGRLLHFGLDHRTSLRFGTAEREGNCIEYAHLFAAAYEIAAPSDRAFVVHSARARFFGLHLPWRGFGDHDWALVESGGRRLFVDPTLADANLGWDVESAVEGQVRLPTRR